MHEVRVAAFIIIPVWLLIGHVDLKHGGGSHFNRSCIHSLVNHLIVLQSLNRERSQRLHWLQTHRLKSHVNTGFGGNHVFKNQRVAALLFNRVHSELAGCVSYWEGYLASDLEVVVGCELNFIICRGSDYFSV